MPSAPGELPAPPHPAHLEPWHLWVRPGKGGAVPGRQAGRCPLGSQAGVPEGALRLCALQSCFAVVLGGPQETGQLLEHKFDYIFFTGEAPVWGLRRMGEVRGLSPAPPLGVSSPTRRGAARDRSRQTARDDADWGKCWVVLSAPGRACSVLPEQAGEQPRAPGDPWEGWAPSRKQASPPPTISRITAPALAELPLCQALIQEPTALLEGWTDEGLGARVTKRCSAHCTSQDWGRLYFAPRGHLPSP